MAGSLGSLVVRLGLDAAEFTTGLSKSEVAAQRFQKRMESNISSAAKFIGTLGIGVAVAAFVKNTIASASALDDLSDATGSSVESLSKLANQAKISGHDFGELQGLMLKLSAGMAGVDEEGSKTGQALAALGVTAKDPAQALQDVAIALNKYADGTGKAALARDLFGKGGPAFLAVLKDMAELQDVSATVTTRQAAEAEKLEKAIRRLSVESTNFKNIILNDAVPATTRLLEQFTEGIRLAGGFWNALRLFSTLPLVGSVGDAMEALTKLNERIKTIEEGRGLEGITARLTGQTARIVADLKTQRAFLERQLDQQIATATGKKAGGADDMTVKPKLDYTGAKDVKPDDTARRILDAQLKELERSIQSEEQLLGDREHFLQQYYQDDQIGIKAFFDGRQNALDEAVEKERAAYAKEQALIRAFKPKDESERIKQQSDLSDAIAKTAKFEEEVSRKRNDLYFENARAVKEFQRSLDSLAIALANARGDTVGAARLSITAQYADQRIKMVNEGRPTGDIDEIIKRTVDQAKLTKATQDYNVILERLGIAQSRLDLQAQSGALSEIELLNKKADIARAYIPILTNELNAQLAIARAMEEGPAKVQALLNVDKLRLGIDQLAASTDALKNKLDATFTDSLTTLFDDLTGRTKNWKDAFLDAGKSIERTFMHLINEQFAKQLYRSLFGDGGVTGGQTPGGWLAALLSSFGSSGSASATSASWSAMSAATIPSFASGTDFAPGGWARVHRDEIINLPRGAQVIPNSELVARRNERAGNTFHISVNVLPDASTQTADQAAAATVREFQKALG